MSARPAGRVGVLGGTFDPLHLGHLRAAEVARDELSLDRVLFVPAANPPHKVGVPVSDASLRIRMMEAALAPYGAFVLSTIEVERGGPSYTIDTMASLRALYPSHELFFITGSDAFQEIRTWHRWKTLLESCAFVVHERPGSDVEAALDVVPESLRGRITVLRREMLDVSATEIRRLAGEGHSIRFLVPDPVADYVQEHRLYLREVLDH